MCTPRWWPPGHNFFSTMGKGLGVFGDFQGKVGNVVGYALKNSNNKQTQGLRAYQPRVTNPRSNGQALQRMLIGPAQRFYKWLIDPVDSQPLMNHSWEGVEYGNKSRQYFMRLAMEQKNGPYIPKSVDYAVPAAYQIAKGSLPSFSILGRIAANGGAPVIDEGDALLVSNIVVPTYDYATTTYGQFCQLLIDNNPSLHNGDQLTFIEVAKIESRYQPTIARLILDVTSTELPQSHVTGSWTLHSYFGVIVNRAAISGETTLFHVAFDVLPPNGVIYTVVAGAVILSRRSGNNWLRSNSTMWIDPSLVELYYTDAALLEAMASYQNEETSATSTRYLNQATRGEVDETAASIARIVYAPIANVTTEGLTGLNGQFFRQGSTVEGALINIVGDNGGVILRDGTEASGTVTSGETTTTVYLTPDILGVGSYPSVNVNDVRI